MCCFSHFSEDQLGEGETTGFYPPLRGENRRRGNDGVFGAADSGVTSGDFSESRQLSQANLAHHLQQQQHHHHHSHLDHLDSMSDGGFSELGTTTPN